MTAPIIATNYEELVAALTWWRGRRRLSQIAVDERAGMHLGYCGKLEKPDGVTRTGKRYGKRAVHPSFDWWLGGVGVALVVVPIGHIRPRAAPDPRQLSFSFTFPHAELVARGKTISKVKMRGDERAARAENSCLASV